MHIACAHCGTTNRVPDERLAQDPVCGRCGQALLATQRARAGYQRIGGLQRGRRWERQEGWGLPWGCLLASPRAG